MPKTDTGKIKLISDLEKKWYGDVSKYLYGNKSSVSNIPLNLSGGSNSMATANGDNEIFKPGTIVRDYRDYNKKFLSKNSTQPGHTLINDIYLTIPPTNIKVSISENSIDIPQVRTKHSVKLTTGYGEVSVALDIPFTDDMLHGISFQDEISYKLVPLLTQLRNMPFIHIDNDYIRDKLVGIAENAAGKNDTVNKNADIMLTYVNHYVSTVAASAGSLNVRFNFLLFNYRPYMNNVVYVRDYLRDENGAITRNAIDDRPLMVSSCFTPERSLAFYEFHAKEFMRLEEVSKYAAKGTIYRHQYDHQDLEFTYYTYMQIPREYIDKSFSDKLDKMDTIQSLDTRARTGETHLPIKGKILSPFGERMHPIEKRIIKHNGIDIRAKKGSPIKATGTGIVTFAAWREGSVQHTETKKGHGYGNLIIIDYGNGKTARYAHLSDFDVQVGDKVYNNTTIGFVGSTGGSTGPHLHYEIRIHGVAVDPLSIIDASENYQPSGTAMSDITGSVSNEDLEGSLYSNNPPKSDTKRKDDLEKQKVLDYINSLKKSDYSFVQSSDKSSDIFLKVSHYYNTNINEIEGLNLLSIENTGGHDVPRIPISGYRYATHQYMGGHVEKIVITLSSSDDASDRVISNIQKILEITSNNAIAYRSVASLDGIGIRNPLINAIVSSDWFALDDIDISTTPNIPNGSIVKITFTDYGRIKENFLKSFKFDFDARKNEYAVFKSIIRGAFKLASVKAEKRYSKVGNFNSSSMAHGRISTQDTTIRYSFSSLNGRLPEALSKAMKILYNPLSEIDFTTKQRDTYNIAELISSVDIIGDKLTDDKNDSMEFSTVLKSWAMDNYDALINNLPNVKDVYNSNILNELESISSSAYTDFDLPPNIDPDYYFYQPEKYTQYNLYSKKPDTSSLQQRWEKYKETLKANDYTGNESQKQDNIIWKLIGKDEDFYKSITDTPPYNTNANNKHLDSEKRSAYEATRFMKSYEDSGMIPDNKDPESINTNTSQRLAYNYTHDYIETMYLAKVEENRLNQSTHDMAMCFPVFKIYVIEEDDGKMLGPLRNDINDMYGLNAIQEIRYVGHSDQPTDLLTVRFVDLSGKFTSQRFKKKSFTENFEIDNTDTEKENPLKGIMLQEGTTIQFRAGYSNNINNLETVFNGQIVSIDGNLNEYSMICQSFGTELVYEKKFPLDPIDPTSFNAETKEILSWATNQPEVKHFGRWKIKDGGNYQISDSSFGLNIWKGDSGLGTYMKQRPDGKEQRVWSWTKNQADLNIMTPHEWWNTGLHKKFNSEGYGPIDTIGIWAVWIKEMAFFDFYNDYYVYNKTLWEVIDEMTYRYPGYVARVVPYGDRNTLFFGPPDSPYFYRPMKFIESIQMQSMNKKRDISNLKSDLSDMYLRIEHLVDIVNENPKHKGKVTRRISVLQKEARKIEKQIVPYKELRGLSARPFRSYWVATSESNIVKNAIKADYRDSYNKVEIVHATTSAEPEEVKNPKSLGASTSLTMNDFLMEEDVRTKTIIAPNCVNKGGKIGGAYRYATHELLRQSKKLYKGNLVLIGEPKIKANDYIVVNDSHTQTYGPVEVRQHVLSIVPGQGMLSSITPGMVSHCDDMMSMSTFDAFMEFASRKHAKSALAIDEKMVGAILPTAFTVSGAALTGIGVAGALGVGMLLSPIGVAITVFTGVAFLALAPKLTLLARNRHPIFLQPLIRGGVPYIVGTNGYRVGGLTEWVEHEVKLFKDGLKSYFSVWKTALHSIVSDR